MALVLVWVERVRSTPGWTRGIVRIEAWPTSKRAFSPVTDERMAAWSEDFIMLTDNEMWCRRHGSRLSGVSGG